MIFAFATAILLYKMDSRTKLGSLPAKHGSSFENTERRRSLAGIFQAEFLAVDEEQDPPQASDSLRDDDSEILEFDVVDTLRKPKPNSRLLSQRLKAQETKKPEKPMPTANTKRKRRNMKNQHLQKAIAIQGDEPPKRQAVKIPSTKATNSFRDPCSLVDTHKKPASITSSFMGQSLETTTVRSIVKENAFESLCESDSVTDEENPQQQPSQQQNDIDVRIPRKKHRTSDAALQRDSPTGLTSTFGTLSATAYIDSLKPEPMKLDLSRAQPPMQNSNRSAFGGLNARKKFQRAKKIVPAECYLEDKKLRDAAAGLTGRYACSQAESTLQQTKKNGTMRTKPEEILVDSPEPSPRRRKTRKSSCRSSIEVIEIDDESENDELLDKVRRFRSVNVIDSLNVDRMRSSQLHSVALRWVKKYSETVVGRSMNSLPVS